MEHRKQFEKDYEFQRKGKKYKTKYFSALKQLLGAIDDDKDCQVSKEKSIEAERTNRADKIC